MSTTTVDWLSLPPELLQTISSHLQTLSTYLRFRAVCKTFLAAAPISPLHLPREFPWLLLPLSPSSPSRLLFLNPLTSTLHRLPLPFSPTCRRAGSSHGYLILISDSPSIFLVNPLTRRMITLPPLSSFPNVVSFDYRNVGREYAIRDNHNNEELYYCSLNVMRDSFIKKVVLSDDTMFAFAILNRGDNVAYCGINSVSWTILEQASGYSEDVIWYDCAFYAVGKTGSIAICDVNHDGPSVKFVNPTAQVIGGDMQYLVDGMGGDLLLVSRYLEFEIDMEHYVEICRTVKFVVYRMDWSVGEWESVTSLDDKVLFLGGNSSFAVLANDYGDGCKGNRIYFTDDYSWGNYDNIAGDHDVGVYDLGDGSVEVLPCYPRNSHWPIWVTPSLC